MTVYCDLDDVLANFRAAFKKQFGFEPPTSTGPTDPKWQGIGPDFYESVELMPGATQLWNYLKPADPIILTGAHRDAVYNLTEQKRDWMQKNLTRGDPVRLIAVEPLAKPLYCEPGDVLIDNNVRYAAPWRKRGGIFIPYTTTSAVIDKLKEQDIP